MLKLLVSSFFMLGIVAQNTSPSLPPGPSPPPTIPPLRFTDTTLLPIVGNYTMGYVNNTQENRCHRSIAKFQAQNTGIVDMLKMGIYSQAAPETCGISFVLSTFPGNVVIGSSLLTTFTDLVAATPGTDEFVKFNTTPSSWSVVAGQNYTITIVPFTWATSPTGGTSTASHCVFQMPYGRPGLPYALLGQYGPTAQPCGSTPWTIDLAGDGIAIQLLLNGHASQVVVPSVSSTPTPTPSSTGTPTPSQTSTPTPSHTPTPTPTITDTPSQTPAPGSSSSISSTPSRTPSRTPSISFSLTPTPSVTSSHTPTETPSPTPSLRMGASPSVTPTETPGPTDSTSPTPSHQGVAGINQQISVSAPMAGSSAGQIVGGIIGGSLMTVALLLLAIRYKIVSAQINGSPKVSSWRLKSKKSSIGELPETSINLNPTIVQQNRAFPFDLRVQKMKESTV